MSITATELQREGFRTQTLVEETYDLFFESIWSKVRCREDFGPTAAGLSSPDRGIYFDVTSSNDPSRVLFRNYTDVRHATQYSDLSEMSRLVLVVMNEPGSKKFKSNESAYVNLTRAYQFRVPHYTKPLYVLCEDEHSLAKNEFLKKH